MEGKFVNSLFSKIKDKLNNNSKKIYPQSELYSFNEEEINDISKQNKEKIMNLKNDKNLDIKEKKISTMEVIKKLSSTNYLEKKEQKDFQEQEIKAEETKPENNNIEETKEENNNVIEEDKNKNSYINIDNEKKEKIMNRWQNIDTVKLDKDIIKGKDILSHNYNITYADEAQNYIYKIRNDYEIVIDYLIGFNNEKKGILNKNIFSNSQESEWKNLKNYIKLLEIIRNSINK